MMRIRPCLSSTLPVTVPKIHHFDAHNNVIIVEDCGADVITLREFLCSASSTDLAETIGAAIGEFIALVHEWSRSNPDGILDVFEKSLHARKMMAYLNYDRLVATLQRTDKDDLTLLSDFKVDASDIQVISKLTDEYRSLLMSPRVPGRDVASLSLKTLSFTLTLINIIAVPHGRPLARKHPPQYQRAPPSSLYFRLGTCKDRITRFRSWLVLRLHGFTRPREPRRLRASFSDASTFHRGLLTYLKSRHASGAGYFGALGY